MSGQILSGNFNCPTCELMAHRNYFYNPASSVSPLMNDTSSILKGLAQPQVQAQSSSSWTPGQQLPGIVDLSKVVDSTFKTDCKVTKTYPKFVFCGDLAAQAEELAPLWYSELTGKEPDKPIEFQSL
jgi:hypothetical protein